ncbi:hypothetical protein [Clavibacter zhangzhiyongii]|uniref:hypothetical protein n=1 Tax=Clavibacter zhangzhiyongii TaxID=2768071 RepID=UPI0039E1E4E7
MRVDLRADFLATGPADVPAGSRTRAPSPSEGAVFDGRGRERAGGERRTDGHHGDRVLPATVHVTASAAFSDLPYGDALDAVGGPAARRSA